MSRAGYAPDPFRSSPKKRTNGCLIALAVVGGVFVLGIGSCGALYVIGKSAQDAKAEEVRKRPADPTDLGGLLAEYKDNEIRGDSEFKGRKIRTSGVVKTVGASALRGGKGHIMIGTLDGHEAIDLFCTLEEGESAASLSRGDKITVEGVVQGRMIDVRLDECRIVN